MGGQVCIFGHGTHLRFEFYGQVAAHQPRRIIMSDEKLWPVHGSFVAMSGSWVQAESCAAFVGGSRGTSPINEFLRRICFFSVDATYENLQSIRSLASK